MNADTIAKVRALNAQKTDAALVEDLITCAREYDKAPAGSQGQSFYSAQVGIIRDEILTRLGNRA
jgi:hypothetical protein